ncbi:MAG: hypothetical protein ABF379_11375 [Akkermansiaceae bacterium]
MSLSYLSFRTKFPLSSSDVFLAFLTSTSLLNAELLFYEPFDYSAGTELQGSTPVIGSEGGWTDTSSGNGTPGGMPVAQLLTVRNNGTNGGLTSGQTWTGIPVDSLFPNEGGFLEGMRRDNNEGHITLSPSVTSQFTDGATIWLSYIAAATTVDGANDNNHEPDLAIGSAPIGGGTVTGAAGDDRARFAQGEAIGATSLWNSTDSSMRASYWDDEGVMGVFTQFASIDFVERILPQQLIIIRIEFGAETEVITTNVFALDSFVVPTLADFETGASSITTVGNLDQTAFNTLSFDAVRTNLDEIRIGTTFDDVNGALGGSGGNGLSIIKLEKAEDSVTITWNSRPGQFYSIDASSDLTRDNWLELSDSVVANLDSETTSFTEFIENGQGLTKDTKLRFYRVRLGGN